MFIMEEQRAPDLSPNDVRRLIDSLNDALYCVDSSRRITYWNKAAERLTGFKAEDVVGKSCSDNILIHVDGCGNSLCRGTCPLATTMKNRKPSEAHIYLHHRNGHRIPVQVRSFPMLNEKQEVVGAIEIFTEGDFRETLHRRITDLEKLALLDPLTQIPNRRHLQSEIAGHLTQFAHTGTPFGLIFFDVDHFKQFNDAHGHDAGDAVLKAVAGTISSCARPYDIIGRWGGEEFVGLFPNTDRPLLSEIAERLCILIRQSRIYTEKGILSVTASLGGSVVEASDTLDSIVQRADLLMYESKRNGRNRVTIR